MKKFALVMGLVLAMGAGYLFTGVTSAQTDPWWHPLNPQGGSHGVTYGTVLPTAANTGYPPTDGLLAVQITAGSQPNLQIYDQSSLSWISLVPGGAGGITDNTIPVWDATAVAFEDSLLTDDAASIRLNANGSAAVPAFLLNDADTGFYLPAANNLGISVGGALVMDLEDTNAAGASADLATISSTLGIMNGTDTVRGLFVDLTNADHAGAGNLVYGIAVDGILGDAQASEYGIYIGDDWDASIYLAESGAAIQFTDELYFLESSAVSLALRDRNGAGTSEADGFAELTLSPLAMDGTDTLIGLNIDLTNTNHTGAGNVLNLITTDALTGDANSDLNALYIGVLTGTAGADGELEVAVNVQAGWDAAFYHAGIAHASLVAADMNGSIVFCTDCDPTSTPCTSAGAQTGAFAFRVNGQWDCPW
jgi:hypothetical protein